MQLIGGNGYSNGNIYVLNSEGYFGPLCDDDYSSVDAGVVCAQLGFRRDKVTRYGGSHFGDVPDKFAMDGIRCNGTEARIQDCYYLTLDNCRGIEGAGVECFEL